MKYKLNRQTINIPESYEELTFYQLRELIRLSEAKETDDVKLICLLVPSIKERELRKYPASEYIKIIYYLSNWTNEVPDFKNIILPNEVHIDGKYYQVPKDVGNLSVEAFEICRNAIKQYESKGMTYLDLCGLISQNYFSMLANNDEFNPKFAFEFEQSILSMNWLPVIAFGNFFLQKFKELIAGTQKELKAQGTLKTRLSLVTKIYKRIGGFFTR